MVKLTFTVTSNNPNTIYNRLRARLGREPTNAEVKADVRRILEEVMVERAGQGRLSWQRKGMR